MTDLPKDLPTEALLEYRLRMCEGKIDLLHKTLNELGGHMANMGRELERSLRDTIAMHGALAESLLVNGVVTERELTANVNRIKEEFARLDQLKSENTNDT